MTTPVPSSAEFLLQKEEREGGTGDKPGRKTYVQFRRLQKEHQTDPAISGRAAMSRGGKEKGGTG